MISQPYVSLIFDHTLNRFDWEFQKFASRRMLETMSFRLSVKPSTSERPTRMKYMYKAIDKTRYKAYLALDSPNLANVIGLLYAQ